MNPICDGFRRLFFCCRRYGNQNDDPVFKSKIPYNVLRQIFPNIQFSREDSSSKYGRVLMDIKGEPFSRVVFNGGNSLEGLGEVVQQIQQMLNRKDQLFFPGSVEQEEKYPRKNEITEIYERLDLLLKHRRDVDLQFDEKNEHITVRIPRWNTRIHSEGEARFRPERFENVLQQVNDALFSANLADTLGNKDSKQHLGNPRNLKPKQLVTHQETCSLLTIEGADEKSSVNAPSSSNSLTIDPSLPSSPTSCSTSPSPGSTPSPGSPGSFESPGSPGAKPSESPKAVVRALFPSSSKSPRAGLSRSWTDLRSSQSDLSLSSSWLRPSENDLERLVRDGQLANTILQMMKIRGREGEEGEPGSNALVARDQKNRLPDSAKKALVKHSIEVIGTDGSTSVKSYIAPPRSPS